LENDRQRRDALEKRGIEIDGSKDVQGDDQDDQGQIAAGNTMALGVEADERRPGSCRARRQ